MKIGCVVLAAGNARRFGSNKLTAQVEGVSLIRRALDAVPGGLATVVVTPVSGHSGAGRGIRL